MATKTKRLSIDLKKFLIWGTIAFLTTATSFSETSNRSPNILFIYLDDLGYGDVSFSNPDSKIFTPHIDRLAREGMAFTDAHAPGPVCGPSRYGLLTGRYPWRRGKDGRGNGAKFRDLFVEEERTTIASLLERKGYNTAQIGKWGLRHNYADAVLPGREPGELDAYDFPNKRLMGSQLVGFDYSWCITYLDKRDSNIKTQFENGLPQDPSLAPVDPYRWLPESGDKVVEYLDAYAGQLENPKFGIDSRKPFFVYWDPPSPHDPIVPNQAFVGMSGAGAYGDFVIEVDHYIGKILNTLDRLDLTKSTLVVFASDNGPARGVYERIQEFDHYSMDKRRGMKTDILEGGHRVPLVVRWPGVIEANQTSNALVSLTDWLATIAEITGQTLAKNAGEDSLSFLSLLKRASQPKPYRTSVIHHTPRGIYAIRERDWVFIDDASPPDSEPEWYRKSLRVDLPEHPAQLYNLKSDPKQTKNLYEQYPEKAQEMKALLQLGIEAGYTKDY